MPLSHHPASSLRFLLCLFCLQVGEALLHYCNCHPDQHCREDNPDIPGSLVTVSRATVPCLAQLLQLLQPPNSLLNKLDLSSSHLRADVLQVVKPLPNLIHLEMSQCTSGGPMEAVLSAVMRHTPALAVLGIKECTLETLPPGICALTTLTKLTVTETGLRHLPEGAYLAGGHATAAGCACWLGRTAQRDRQMCGDVSDAAVFHPTNPATSGLQELDLARTACAPFRSRLVLPSLCAI
jgi:hypothetical protein